MCTVDYCPAPTSPEWHVCWCGALAVEHHHVDPRRMGGSPSRLRAPENVVALCHKHHEGVTTGGNADAILETPDGWSYVYYAPGGKVMFERKLARTAAVHPQLEVEPASVTDASRTAAVRGAVGGVAVMGESEASSPAPLSEGALLTTPPWTASALTDREDRELAEEFHELYRASGVLALEACRRIEAYRLKWEAAAGEGWVQAAEDVFDLRPKTLYAYARAWQAFEEQALQSDCSDALMEMGGGAWQLIGRAPREQWQEMAELALSVVADQGVGRGLVAAVAARAQDEGLIAPPIFRWRCPDCGREGKQSEFREAREEAFQA